MTTNYERIKNMTTAEMAKYFSEHIICDNCPASEFCDFENATDENCYKYIENWLQSESEA